MKQLYEIEFDEANLGPMWMNVDNLRTLLYSNTHITKPELLRVRAVKPSLWRNIFLGLVVISLVIIAMSCVLMTGLYMWDFSILLNGV